MVDPKVVDTELAEANGEAARLKQRIGRYLDSLHRYAGDRRTYIGRRQVWGMTDADAEERARGLVGVAPYEVSMARDTLRTLDESRAALVGVRARIAELDALYTGWSRFFLVTDGHIHASMACSTCRVTTQFGWLPQLSGETEADAVAAHGALLCTVCYPTAPVEWTSGPEKPARCAGSGQGYDPDRAHETRRMSRWGYCRVCGTRQTVTPNGYIRAHG